VDREVEWVVREVEWVVREVEWVVTAAMTRAVVWAARVVACLVAVLTTTTQVS